MNITQNAVIYHELPFSEPLSALYSWQETESVWTPVVEMMMLMLILLL